MNTRHRIRGTIKWGGAVVTVLLLIVWVGSKWYWGRAQLPPTIGIAVGPGQIELFWEVPWSLVPVGDFWDGGPYSGMPLPPYQWWFEFDRSTWGTGTAITTQIVVVIPIWFLVLLAATPTFLIWRHDRKRPPGTCRKCGYSRTGLPADRACPECGTAA